MGEPIDADESVENGNMVAAGLSCTMPISVKRGAHGGAGSAENHIPRMIEREAFPDCGSRVF